MDENQNLQRQIDELKRRLDAKDRQQITYPLDYESIEALNKYFMRITKTILTIGGIAAKTFISYIGQQGSDGVDTGNLGAIKFVVSENTYAQYTTNATTDYLTLVQGSRFRFVDDEAVYFITEDTYPDPLDGVTTYYIINANDEGTTFQITTVSGSAPDIVDFADTGTGAQYLFYL